MPEKFADPPPPLFFKWKFHLYIYIPLWNSPNSDSTFRYFYFSDTFEQLVDVAELLFAGYLLHYLPYLAEDRTLFIYSYLPALCFQILLTAYTIEHIYNLLWK